MAGETIGLENDKVLLYKHQSAWAQLFAKEKRCLRQALGNAVLDIQHVGSTAIFGLQAKPLLDIAVAVKNFEEAFSCIQPLATLGYLFRGENGVSRRHNFVKGPPARRTHHLHMLETDSSDWYQLIAFRDYVRTHPQTAAQYQTLKLRLAERFPSDLKAYTAGKHDFIQDVLRAAHES